MAEQTSLLDGVRVVDLTRVLAGPYCTMMLGDLGAEVIKIEVPGRGDDTRHWGPPFTEGGESAYFLSANRNKRSLTLNLKDEQAIEILKELIRRGDVLVDNFLAGTLDRFGLSEEVLRELRPDLVYCTVTGYGYSGPYRDRPGYDFIVQALGGFMSVTGPTEGEPTRAGVAIADLAAGMFAASAILAALFDRQRSPRWHRIDISLLDSMVALMSYVASNFLVSGERPPRFGNGHPNIVPYQSFRASDMYFAFAAGNDAQWERFCRAVDQPQWAEDPKFANNAARLEHRTELVGRLQELFATREAAEWMALCQQIGIAAAPINPLDHVFEDPQVQARGLRTEVEHPTEGQVPLVGSPLNVLTAPPAVRRAPPTLGQHTNEILQWLGYSDAAIDDLHQRGAV